MSSPSSNDTRSLLSEHWLFSKFDSATLNRLIRYARIETFDRNKRVFQKGDPGHNLLAVIKGRVKISAAGPDDKRVVLNIIDAGEIFGEIGFLDGDERTADATAMEITELLILDRRDFVPFLHRNPEVSLQLLQVLCHRIRRTSEQVEEFIFLDREARLAKALLRLADEFGREVPDGTAIDLRLSQRELGQLIGMTREAMNKQLRVWREAELIHLEKGVITIRKRHALENFAGEFA